MEAPDLLGERFWGFVLQLAAGAQWKLEKIAVFHFSMGQLKSIRHAMVK